MTSCREYEKSMWSQATGSKRRLILHEGRENGESLVDWMSFVLELLTFKTDVGESITGGSGTI